MSPDQDHWESLKNTAVSQRNLLPAEESGSTSTTERSASPVLTSSTSTEQQDSGAAEQDSPTSSERDHLLYTAHEVHDYPGHKEHVNSTGEATPSGADQETSRPEEQANGDDAAEAELTNMTTDKASEATVTHSETTNGEIKSKDDKDAKADATEAGTVVVFPDEVDGIEGTELNEVGGPDAAPTELTSGGMEIAVGVDTDAVSETDIISSEADTQAGINKEPEPSSARYPATDKADRKAANAVEPETASSPSPNTTLSGPKSDEDLEVGETRQAPSTSPEPADTNLGGTTTTTVTISDRRLDDTGGELTRLLQDASRSTTISVTSPDFTNGTFIAQLHGKQNPWLQRYAPFFYPQNPLPVTYEALERRQTPAPELRRLRIEHLVLVPPSSYPDEVLRTVHDAKLRALPRPQEEVHIHLGRGETEGKPTVQELARGAKFAGDGKVKDVNEGSVTRGSSGVYQRLLEEAGGEPRPEKVHGETVPFGHSPGGGDQVFPHDSQSGAELNQPEVNFQPEVDNAPVDFKGFSQPRPEDILTHPSPDRHGTSQEVNFRPPSAEQQSVNGYAAPRPEDIVPTTVVDRPGTVDQPASNDDFEHRLPAHVPPISVGFSAPKPQDVLNEGELNKGHITDVLQPPTPTFSVHSSTPNSAEHSSSVQTSSGHSSSPSSATSSGYSSPKPQDVVLAGPSGRLVSSEPSTYTLGSDTTSDYGPNQNSVFSPPKPDDVIPLSESFMYDKAHATAAGVPEERKNEYGAPKLSSLVGPTRGQTSSGLTPGLKTTQVVVSNLAMKEVAPPEFGSRHEYRQPKLVDLLRPSGGGTRTQGHEDKNNDGYGTPKPSQVLKLSELQKTSILEKTSTDTKSNGRLKTPGGGTLKGAQLYEGFVFNAGQLRGFTRPKPEDVILAGGEFVGVPDYLMTRADNFKPHGSADDTDIFLSAILPAATPTEGDTGGRQKATKSLLDTRENSVYYIPSVSPSTPKPERLTNPLVQTAFRPKPASIYDILASPQPRGLPEISSSRDSGAVQRPDGEPSLDSPLYADAGWRPNLSPFGQPRTGDGGQRAGRRLAEGAEEGAGRGTEDEERWVWPRTTRADAVSGRVLFRDT